jgi:hypothetical protein
MVVKIYFNFVPKTSNINKQPILSKNKNLELKTNTLEIYSCSNVDLSLIP